MYAGEGSRANGGGGGDGLRRRRQPESGLPYPGPAAGASSSSSSSAREEAERGGRKEQGRRKKQGTREAVVRAVRAGLPAAAVSCWGGGGGVSVVQGTGRRSTGRSWSQPERAADAGNGEDGPGPGATASTSAAAAAWCCVCPGGDCSLEPNPSANGKEDPGARSLLELNDFFSPDCNAHADVLPTPGAASSP